VLRDDGSAPAGRSSRHPRTSLGGARFCTSFDSPPQEFLDEESTQRDRTSTSVLLGFDAIIGALQAGQCDAINSSLSYTEERDQVVDYALYGLFTDVIIVGGGNPQDIQAVDNFLANALAG
jgi:ABC-type amino acid transport substrate-binding protein